MESDRYKILVDKFDAKLSGSRTYYYQEMLDVSLSYDHSHDDMLNRLPRQKIPLVEVTILPHRLEMICGMLEAIDRDHGDRGGIGMSGPLVRYTEHVLKREHRERAIREENPAVQSLWEQYQMALRLCE